MEFPESWILPIVTLVIALYGAILSTIKIVSDHRTLTRKIRVKLSYSLIANGNIVSPTMLAITVINPAHRPVTVTSASLLLPDGRLLVLTHVDSLPATLTEQSPKVDIFKSTRALAFDLEKADFSGEIKLRGYVQTATGEIFKSKPIKFSIEKEKEPEPEE